jgi:hypothetical protein
MVVTQIMAKTQGFSQILGIFPQVLSKMAKNDNILTKFPIFSDQFVSLGWQPCSKYPTKSPHPTAQQKTTHYNFDTIRSQSTAYFKSTSIFNLKNMQTQNLTQKIYFSYNLM